MVNTLPYCALYPLWPPHRLGPLRHTSLGSTQSARPFGRCRRTYPVLFPISPNRTTPPPPLVDHLPREQFPSHSPSQPQVTGPHGHARRYHGIKKYPIFIHSLAVM
ncbi:hypothetical protein P691DRAFT_320462 [Macrolepiota fuliginosa MF-IS2]|uniref:Uncharacterized protein n=1 Tax=Macrolepiota fuliginosa MF-IS2 TaxID=1400762 RepID=A0A9P5XJY3_9AGAR|nr:hypothetical protein P691DRAFT_320462 [Macrolepiota fuliginosa MF-IS2]